MADLKQISNAAMALLSRREYSKQELVQKLQRKFGATPVVFDAIDALAEQGLQSDARYTEAFVRFKFGAGKGPQAIRHQLRTAGISEQLMDDALFNEALDWFESASSIALKKYARETGDTFVLKSKCYRFLASRGFEREHIDFAISQLLAD